MSKILLLLLFCYLIIVCFINPKRKLSTGELLIYLLIILLIVIFRPEEMPDYENYKNSFINDNERYEPIFQLIFEILHIFTRDYFYFFSCVALLTITTKWVAIIKMSTFIELSFLIWISYMLILQDMIAIRAALAASIFLWAIYFKCNNNRGLMWLALICSAVCHYSAIILFILPVLSNLRINKVLYISLLLTASIIAALGFSVTDLFHYTGFSAYDKMLDNYISANSTDPFKPQQILRLIICLILWLNIDAILTNKYILICLKAYTIGCIVFFLSWKIAGAAIRLSELFIITEIIIIPQLAICFGYKNLKITKLLPIGIASIVFLFEYNLPGIWIEQL